MGEYKDSYKFNTAVHCDLVVLMPRDSPTCWRTAGRCRLLVAPITGSALASFGVLPE